jgi:hypothetical protein
VAALFFGAFRSQTLNPIGKLVLLHEHSHFFHLDLRLAGMWFSMLRWYFQFGARTEDIVAWNQLCIGEERFGLARVFLMDPI